MAVVPPIPRNPVQQSLERHLEAIPDQSDFFADMMPIRDTSIPRRFREDEVKAHKTNREALTTVRVFLRIRNRFPCPSAASRSPEPRLNASDARRVHRVHGRTESLKLMSVLGTGRFVCACD